MKSNLKSPLEWELLSNISTVSGIKHPCCGLAASWAAIKINATVFQDYFDQRYGMFCLTVATFINRQSGD